MLKNKKQNLIGLAGRIGNGKDLVASIIKYLTCEGTLNPQNFSSSGNPNNMANLPYEKWVKHLDNSSPFIIKKYADKLKDIVCILLGCTRLNLEDRTFKETELGEQWRVYYKIYNEGQFSKKTFITKNQYDILHKTKIFGNEYNVTYHTEILTPRKLMQILGTECGREIIHPNIWINALFADYKPKFKGDSNAEYRLMDCRHFTQCSNCGKDFYQDKNHRYCIECIEDDSFQVYPHWIISDVRFPLNEGKGVTDRGGINIGIKRKFSLRFPDYAHLEDLENPYSIPLALKEIDEKLYINLTHSSEELMGDFEWCDYVIENNGTIDELIEEVRTILTKENVI